MPKARRCRKSDNVLRPLHASSSPPSPSPGCRCIFRTCTTLPSLLSPHSCTLSAHLVRQGAWTWTKTPSPDEPSPRAPEPSARQRRCPAVACAQGAHRPCVGLGCADSRDLSSRAWAHPPSSPASTPLAEMMIGSERSPQRTVCGACRPSPLGREYGHEPGSVNR